METRSSPSWQVLQGLARQAHLEPQDLSTLSKPALFGHLRSNYDYNRLERAHQIALKRADIGADTNDNNHNNANINDENRSESSVPRSKRRCRDVNPTSDGASSSRSSAQCPSSDGQTLPAASIFIQTRSRSRFLLAASAGGGSGSGSGSGSVAAGSAAAGSGSGSVALTSSTAESAARSRVASARGGTSSCSPRPRAARRCSQIKLSRGRAWAAGDCSGGGSSSSGTRSSNGGSCSAGRAGGGAGQQESNVAEMSSAAGENTAKRRKSSGAEGTSSSSGRIRGRAKGKGNGKGKGKAKAKTKTKTKTKASVGARDGRGESRGSGRNCDGGAGADPGCGGDMGTRVAGGGKVSSSSSSVSGCLGEKGDKDGRNDDDDDHDDDDYDDAAGRVNELDPIMLVKVGKQCHRFVRPNGRVVMYNLDSLVDYFISTGDFLEPETRLPFSDEELGVIDSKVKAAGLLKPSVLEAKRNPGRYTQQKFQQDALVGLERMISELVTGMLGVVEKSDREEGEIRLVTELFPPFADLFKQMRTADEPFAAQCMEHYTSWLQGPPNRPTEDEMGFLEIILEFLKQLQECDGSSPLGF